MRKVSIREWHFHLFQLVQPTWVGLGVFNKVKLFGDLVDCCSAGRSTTRGTCWCWKYIVLKIGNIHPFGIRETRGLYAESFPKWKQVDCVNTGRWKSLDMDMEQNRFELSSVASPQVIPPDPLIQTSLKVNKQNYQPSGPRFELMLRY